MTRTLRPYQQEAVTAVRAEWASGNTRTAVVHATGLGKGDIIASIAANEARAGGRVLILTHRNEIMGQIAGRCPLYSPGVRVGQIQGSLNQNRSPITVAMVPTLAARLRAIEKAETERDRARRRHRMPGQPTLVIADECHYARAESWMRTLEWAGVFGDDPVRLVGFTATLFRADKRGLGDLFQSVADEKGIDWGIAHGPNGPVRAGEIGFLVRPRGRAVVASHLDLEHAKISKGDYQDGQLGEMVQQDADQIVKAWREHALLGDGRYRPTAAFCPTVASAQALYEEFRAAGHPAGLVLGTTKSGPGSERERIYKALATGEIQVMVNVLVATTGWDCPPVSCILQCRPTKLAGLYQQMVGRGLRPHPASGKADCLVLDVVGASRRQRLITLTDLVKSSYDRTELDDLPCPCCGSKCRCPAGCERCECAPGEDGEEEAGSGTGQVDERLRLIGPATYEEIDFFAWSTAAWLSTHGGVRFLPAAKRMAVLWDNGDDTWTVGHCTTRGMYDRQARQMDYDWQLISESETLDYARRLAESWAMTEDATTSTRSASWRKRGGKPSEAQVSYARTLGIPEPETMNKPRLSDEISIALASRVLD